MRFVHKGSGCNLRFLLKGKTYQKKLAFKVINDLLTKEDLIRTIFIEDVKVTIGKGIKNVIDYSFIPPLDVDDFIKQIKGCSGVIYGGY